MKKFIVFTIITLFIGTLSVAFLALRNYFYPKQYAKNESGEYVRQIEAPDDKKLTDSVAVSNNSLEHHADNRLSHDEAKETKSLEKESKKQGYIAKSFNGTIVILNADGKTVYEFTRITLNLLPEVLQDEVLKGYPLENDEALYNFLETYSS